VRVIERLIISVQGKSRNGNMVTEVENAVLGQRSKDYHMHYASCYTSILSLSRLDDYIVYTRVTWAEYTVRRTHHILTLAERRRVRT
jgi:hypothetical protein